MGNPKCDLCKRDTRGKYYRVASCQLAGLVLVFAALLGKVGADLLYEATSPYQAFIAYGEASTAQTSPLQPARSTFCQNWFVESLVGPLHPHQRHAAHDDKYQTDSTAERHTRGRWAPTVAWTCHVAIEARPTPSND